MSDMVTIQIEKRHYDVLSRWASVGRTIDASVNIIDEFVEQLGKFRDLTDKETQTIAEAADHIIAELRDLKQPLDACNAACKRVYHEQLMEGKVEGE